MRDEHLVSEPDLAPLVEDIRRVAANSDLTILDALPRVSDFPTVIFAGTWQRFVEVGARAGATFLYVEQDTYSPEFLVSLLVSRQAEHKVRSLANGVVSPDDAEQWLRERLRETIAPWDKYRGAIGSVRCLWVHQGILHLWARVTDWHTDVWSAADDAIQVLDHTAQADRRERGQADATLLHDLAMQLAHHPRFPDAKSDAKRLFMAEQLFADQLRNESHRFNAREIASRAEMIYWWDVEPVERVTKDQRVREMRAHGESVRNIAAILKMSEAKVRAALEES